MSLSGGCGLELTGWKPSEANKSVELEKIDELTFVPKKTDKAEQFLFCPECYATFTSGEMKEAYQDYTKAEAEANKEALLKEAFDKEFAQEDKKFFRNSQVFRWSVVVFLLGFSLFYVLFSWKFQYDYLIWLGVPVFMVVVFLVNLSLFMRKRNKSFEEFKKSHKV